MPDRYVIYIVLEVHRPRPWWAFFWRNDPAIIEYGVQANLTDEEVEFIRARPELIQALMARGDKVVSASFHKFTEINT